MRRVFTAALLVLAFPVTGAAQDPLIAFGQADRNADGVLTPDELENVSTVLGGCTLDANGDGALSLDEFLAGIRRGGPCPEIGSIAQEEALRDLRERYVSLRDAFRAELETGDLDGDGALDVFEVRGLPEGARPKIIDRDGDRQISRDEQAELAERYAEEAETEGLLGHVYFYPPEPEKVADAVRKVAPDLYGVPPAEAAAAQGQRAVRYYNTYGEGRGHPAISVTERTDGDADLQILTRNAEGDLARMAAVVPSGEWRAFFEVVSSLDELERHFASFGVSETGLQITEVIGGGQLARNGVMNGYSPSHFLRLSPIAVETMNLAFRAFPQCEMLREFEGSYSLEMRDLSTCLRMHGEIIEEAPPAPETDIFSEIYGHDWPWAALARWYPEGFEP